MDEQELLRRRLSFILNLGAMGLIVTAATAPIWSVILSRSVNDSLPMALFATAGAAILAASARIARRPPERRTKGPLPSPFMVRDTPIQTERPVSYSTYLTASLINAVAAALVIAGLMLPALMFALHGGFEAPARALSDQEFLSLPTALWLDHIGAGARAVLASASLVASGTLVHLLARRAVRHGR